MKGWIFRMPKKSKKKWSSIIKLPTLKKQKNQQSDSADQSQDAPLVKKDKKETLASVLNDSVPQAAVQILSKEPKLTATKDGQTCYITYMINADDPVIGGINKKRRNNEAIGSLIEMITNGRIQTYIPEGLLNDDKLLIIPTASTMDALGDFTMMTDANLNYQISLVYQNGSVDITDATMTYQDIVNYLNDQETTAEDLLIDKHVIKDQPKQVPDSAAMQSPANNADPNDLLIGGVPDNGGIDSSSNDMSDFEEASDDDVTNALLSGQESPAKNTTGLQDANSVNNLSNNQAQTPADNQASDQVAPADNQPDAMNNQIPANQVANVYNNQESANQASASSANQASNTQAPNADQVPAGSENDVLDDASDLGSYGNNDATNDVLDDTTTNAQAPDAAQDVDFEDYNPDADQDYDNLQNDDDIPDAADEELAATPEDQDKALKRHFYSDELDLDIDTKPIETELASFKQHVSYFPEHMGDGYVNQYMNQFAHEANQKLKETHYNNINKAISDYYQAVTAVIHTIASDADDNNPDTTFGKQRREIEDVTDQKLAEMADKAEAKRQEMQAAFEKRVEAAGKSAAEIAKQNYRERFDGENQEKQSKVQAQMQAEIEADRERKLEDLQKREKSRVKDLVDQAITNCVADTMRKYRKAYKDEIEEQKSWRRRMENWRKHHLDDLAKHDKLVAQDVENDKKGQELRRDYEQKLSDTIKQNSQQVEKLEQRIKELKAENKEALQKANTDYDARAQNLESTNTSLQKQMKIIKDNYESQLASQKTKYEAQIKEALANANTEKQDAVTAANNAKSASESALKAQIEQLKNDKLAQQKDYEAKLEELNNENKAKLDEAVDQLKKQNELDIKGIKTDLNGEIKNLKAEKESLKKRIRSSEELINTLKDNNQTMFANAPLMPQAMMQAQQAPLPQQSPTPANNGNSNKKSNALNIVLATIAGAGLLFGGYMWSNNQKQTEINNMKMQMYAQKQASQKRKSDDDSKINDAVNNALAKYKAEEKAKKQKQAAKASQAQSSSSSSTQNQAYQDPQSTQDAQSSQNAQQNNQNAQQKNQDMQVDQSQQNNSQNNQNTQNVDYDASGNKFDY